MTAIRASKKLALSFRTMEQDDVHRIVVVPPLIRQEVTSIQPEEGNYIHGYMVNSGFSDSVEKFHICHPEIPLKFFWDKADTEEVTKVDETLCFIRLMISSFSTEWLVAGLMQVRQGLNLSVKRCILENLS